MTDSCCVTWRSSRSWRENSEPQRSPRSLREIRLRFPLQVVDCLSPTRIPTDCAMQWLIVILIVLAFLWPQYEKWKRRQKLRDFEAAQRKKWEQHRRE